MFAAIMLWARVICILAVIATIYICWIRPILKKTPALADLYASEETFWQAFSAKFSGIKQKLTTAIATLAGVLMLTWDNLAPLVGQVDTTPLTQKIPSWLWPIISIGLLLLVNWFRSMSDTKAKETIAAVIDDPAAVIPPTLQPGG